MNWNSFTTKMKCDFLNSVFKNWLLFRFPCLFGQSWKSILEKNAHVQNLAEDLSDIDTVPFETLFWWKIFSDPIRIKSFFKSVIGLMCCSPLLFCSVRLCHLMLAFLLLFIAWKFFSSTLSLSRLVWRSFPVWSVCPNSRQRWIFLSIWNTLETLCNCINRYLLPAICYRLGLA